MGYGGGGTVGVADLYGTASRVIGAAEPMGIANPNGGMVAPMTQQASGAGIEGGTAPAIAWLGLVVSLIALRVVLSLARAAD